MKSVEIEFLMKDKLSPGLNKAGRSAEDLGDKAGRISKDITKRIVEQKEQIKYVENSLKDLNKQYEKLAPGKAQQEMRLEIEACTKALNEDKNILAELEGQHKKTAASSQRLSMQLRQMLDDMARMRLEGKQNSQAYQDMAAKAATLRDTIGDLRAQTNILAHDNAGLQGVISGVNGLAGGFTVATGLMGVFASENEDLIKVQTRVQSVMAVTMGLQQVMNVLNKDSAFRLVTVVKMKNLLTAANTRLATSLRISNTAAKLLMGTLTLGLTAGITALIYLYDKYSDAQQKAAQKAKERVQIESDGRAQMVKTRFEIDSTIRSLENFKGTKEQEKAKVDELNKAYGESFGYYKTIAEWYDVLQKKGEDYIQMLFLQAKVQSLISKATEIDNEVNEVKAQDPGDVQGSMGWISKLGLYTSMSPSKAKKEIDEYNEKNKQQAIASLETKKKEYLDEAQALQEEYNDKAAKAGIGGFSQPEKDSTSVEQQEKMLFSLRLKAKQKIEDNYIQLMRDSFERRRRQEKLNLSREIDQINEDAKTKTDLINKLSAAGKKIPAGELQKVATDAAALRDQAIQICEQNIQAIDKEEEKLNKNKSAQKKKELDELLAKYQDYDRQREAVEKSFNADLEKLEKARTKENSLQIDKAAAELKRKKAKTLQDINDNQVSEMKKNSRQVAELFADMSTKSVAEIQKIIDKYELLMLYMSLSKNDKGDAVQTNDQGEETTAVSKDSLFNLGFTEKDLELYAKSPKEVEALAKAIKRLKGEMKSRSPFQNFKNDMQDVFDLFSKGGADNTGKGLMKLGQAINDFLPTLKNFGNDLGNIFGKDVSNQVDGIAESIGGLASTAGGVGQIMSGDIVGGAMSAVSGISSLVSGVSKLFGANYDKYNKAKEQYESYTSILSDVIDKQKELVETLDGQNAQNSYDYAKSLVDKSDQAARQLGRDRLNSGASKGSHSIGVRQQDNMSKAAWDELWTAGGQEVHDLVKHSYRMQGLFDLSAEQLENLQEKAPYFWASLDADVRKYLEDIIQCGEKSEELDMSMSMNRTQVSFDSVYDEFKDMLMDMDSDSDDFTDGFEKKMQKAMINSMIASKYKDKLKEWYDAFSQANKDGNIDEKEYERLMEDYRNITQAALKERDQMKEMHGWQDEESTTQQARSGMIQTITQEQGTRLDGLMTALDMHAASIDKNVESISDAIGDSVDHLRSIDENTGAANEKLDKIAENLETIIRDGLSMQ